MAIELERGVDKSKVWAVLILIIAVLAIAALVLSYFYFDFSSKKLAENIQDKNSQLSESQSEKSAKEELSAYETKINLFKKVLESHKKTGNVFSVIEQMIHPEVWFNSFGYQGATDDVNLSGRAPDFIVIAQQIMILQQHKDILSKIKLSGLTREKEGGVTFSLTLTMASQVFK